MSNKHINFWASDFSKNSGEGKLARLYIDYLKKNENTKVIRINTNKKNNFLNYKYISPFLGIFYCWRFFVKGEKIAYINYLPLWNPFIFILLPPKTIIGPITGGALFNKKNYFDYLIRKYLFKILYKISEFFLNFRTNKILFSTDLLKKYVSKKTLAKSTFNFVFTGLKFNKKYKKKIDFLIYYRKHRNKENFFPTNLISKLVKSKYKVFVIGDNLNIPSIKNCGIIKNSKVSKLQSIAKYTIGSGENPYSFFNLECMSNHVKIIINKIDKNKINFYKKNFIILDFKKLDTLKNINKKIIRLNE